MWRFHSKKARVLGAGKKKRRNEGNRVGRGGRAQLRRDCPDCLQPTKALVLFNLIG